jgi:hypothetical protein
MVAPGTSTRASFCSLARPTTTRGHPETTKNTESPASPSWNSHSCAGSAIGAAAATSRGLATQSEGQARTNVGVRVVLDDASVCSLDSSSSVAKRNIRQFSIVMFDSSYVRPAVGSCGRQGAQGLVTNATII